MTFLPIVARELRVAARRRTTYLLRVGAAFVPIAVAGFWLPVLAAQFSTSQGKLLFWFLATLAFAYCLVAGVRATSDCVSTEKREGTIGLLFLTDLKGYDVVFGKLVSSSLAAVYGLLAIVPVLALALLLGGVTLAEVGRMSLLFLNTLFFSMVAGIFCSTLSRNDRRAMFATSCVVLLVAAAPYGVTYGLRLLSGPGASWVFDLDLRQLLKLSPLYGFLVLRSSPGPLALGEFYRSLLAIHLLSWSLLALASWIVPHVCRERPPGEAGLRWQEFRNRWSYGGPARRRAFRARLLDRNAFFWLAARDRIKAYYVWFFVGALALIWCWSGWLLQSFIFDWEISFSLLFLLFVFFKVWLASEVCTRFVEDRASGAFELVLSTPLAPKDMAHGQSLALRRQFGRPIAVALMLTALLLVSALRSPHSGLAAGEIKLLFASLAILLIADLIALQWVGMWQAIRTSQINRATAAACARILVLPTVIFLVLYAGSLVWRVAQTGGVAANVAGRVALLWLTIGLITDLFFGLQARWRFFHQFREVASGQNVPAGGGVEPFFEAFRNARRRLFASSPSNASAPRPSGIRWSRWLVASPVLLLVLAIVVLAFWKNSLNRSIDRQLAAIRAAGEPVTLTELQSWGPPFPDKENAAVSLQKAAGQLVSSRQLPRNAAGSAKLEWPGPVAPVTPELRNRFLEMLALNRQALPLLHAAAKQSRSRHTLDRQLELRVAYSLAFGPLATAAEVLQWEALFYTEQGDRQQAVRSVEALLALGRALAQEPVLAAQHIRLPAINRAVRALERILNHHALEDHLLRSLTEQLRDAEMATAPALASAFVGERCLALVEFQPDRPKPPAWALTAGEQLRAQVVNFSAELTGMRQRHCLEFLQTAEKTIQRARLLDAQGLANTSSPAAPNWVNISGLEQYWEFTIEQHLEMIARLRAAQAALAVERFRTVKGRLPQNLAPLEREFLLQVPLDPFSGQAVRLRNLEAGYLVYSVGSDRLDNEGVEPTRARSGQIGAAGDVTFRVER